MSIVNVSRDPVKEGLEILCLGSTSNIGGEKGVQRGKSRQCMSSLAV